MLIFNVPYKIKKSIPQFILDVLTDKIVLAGGAARAIFTKEPIHDFDLFVNTDQEVYDLEKYFIGLNGTLKFKCPKNELTTVVVQDAKIQIIKVAQFKNIDELLDSFDFTVCLFATNGSQLFVLHQEVLRHAKNKWLLLHKLTYPTATLKRTAKYIKYGYYATSKLYQDIVEKLWERDPNIKDTQLVYVD